MRLSRYFLPLLKETPADAQIASHRLMLRSGMIRQQASGLYTWLPLGQKVLAKIESIVAEELNRAGCIRVMMPTLQSADLWRESGRYDAYGKELLRMKDRHDRDLLYSPTCEEMIVDNFRSLVRSYKSLPMNLYQINWKFRDELRPRFGVMRGREFYMKDGYSFHMDIEDAKREYNLMYDTYHRIFNRLGLTAIAVNAVTGQIGGNMSHEFQVLAETGESDVYYDCVFDDIRSGKVQMSGEEARKLYAAADELHIPEKCPISSDKLRQAKGIEVGQIFLLGSKYTDALGVDIAGEDGKPVRVQMGTYGIGVSRLVGAIIEASHDDNGIIWPKSVSPFDVGLINLKVGDERCDDFCESLYSILTSHGKDVLYYDTDERAGVKFASCDLIGLTWQIVVGPKGIKEEMVELKNRSTGEKYELSTHQAIERLLAV
ncbi:MAG: proline--tRNA ligase [Rickettsiales bacterium]